MDTQEILAQLDAEIARLQQAKSLLSGTTTIKTKSVRTKAGHTSATPLAVKRTLSPEAREKIAAAQRKRWAKTKKPKKLVSRSRLSGGANSGRTQHEPFVVKAEPAVQQIATKRILSPEARARIAAAQKARWAKVKKSAK